MACRISAGYLDSLLRTRGDVSHGSVKSAMKALRTASGKARLYKVTGENGEHFVYVSKKKAQADDDGASALATIQCKRKTR